MDAQRGEGARVTYPVVTFDPEPHAYTVNGVAVPSVTQVLDILAVGALPWWGMTTGVEGVLDLLRRDGMEALLGRAGAGTVATQEVVDLLTANQLTVNHRRDAGGKRG